LDSEEKLEAQETQEAQDCKNRNFLEVNRYYDEVINALFDDRKTR
jgi:hypothetical protein